MSWWADSKGCLWIESGPTRPLSQLVHSSFRAVVLSWHPPTPAPEQGSEWNPGRGVGLLWSRGKMGVSRVTGSIIFEAIHKRG